MKIQRLILALLVLSIVYYETWLSMVDVWLRSDTFAHGFLVIPSIIYLIWLRRKTLAKLPVNIELLGFFMLSLFGFVWFISKLAEVSVVQQFSLVGMLICLIWGMQGKVWTSSIAYPLALLFFAVPFGEFLLNPMMNFTARFSVFLLRLTGLSVYQDGTLFSLPTGNWSVIEECSGLRYLIASIMLGCFFAYLNYVSWRRRLIFIAFSGVFPLIANGFRAYLTVMIGHFIGMEYARGFAHLIYGWLFFALVMFMLFWIGSKWSQPFEEQGMPKNVETIEATPPLKIIDSRCSLRDFHCNLTVMAEAPPLKRKKLLPDGSITPILSLRERVIQGVRYATFTVIVCGLLLIWPIWATQIENNPKLNFLISPFIEPKALLPWHAIKTSVAWQPIYAGADIQSKNFYSNGSQTVYVFLNLYQRQRPGHELIESQNRLISADQSIWKMPEETSIRLDLNGKDIVVRQARLLSNRQNILVWRLNWVAGQWGVDDFLAKIYEVKDKFLGIQRIDASLIIATEFNEGTRPPVSTLREFMQTMLPSIEKSLNGALL